MGAAENVIDVTADGDGLGLSAGSILTDRAALKIEQYDALFGITPAELAAVGAQVATVPSTTSGGGGSGGGKKRETGGAKQAGKKPKITGSALLGRCY